MMSIAQSQTTLEAKLGALQCHFTWDLDSSKSKLFCLRDTLEDIGTEEGNSWLGHIYNLQGYIHCQLSIQYQQSSTEVAQCFFSSATEAFRRSRNTVSDEGPWLVVNYGNLAWLHHRLGEQAECQTYLSKVDTLLKKYPSPSQDKFHPEIYAEKAWTLMNFGKDKKQLAADYFQEAINMQPDVVEWRTSRVIALVNDYKQQDILEKMKIAKEHDPENLYLAALFLEECAKKGRKIEDEARELAERVLRKPVSSYSGMTPLLRLFREYVSIDEAIDLAEEALKKHPDKRHLQRCAAACYKWKIYSDKDNLLRQSMIDRAISLHNKVICLYPDSSCKMEIALANIYPKSNHSQAQAEAEQVYRKLLESHLERADRQMVYNCYAKYLHFTRNEIHKSIEYHMMAAEIPLLSRSRENSIRTLTKIKERNRNRMCGEIEEFLANLKD